MTVIIDRRKNISEKSVTNRKRFVDRSQKSIQKSIAKNLRTKGIQDILGGGDSVTIPGKDISEPVLSHSGKTGSHDYVVPGNDVYDEGDLFRKPYGSGDGDGPGDGEGSPDDMDMEDQFRFTLTRDEFLAFFFDDLELPDLLKRTLAQTEVYKLHRDGFTKTGSPANLNLEQSFKRSLGRRLALHRPSDEEIKELENKIQDMMAATAPGHWDATKEERLEAEKEIDALRVELEELRAKQRVVPYFDDMDVRFNSFAKKPDPATKAVMFCLMDVSGSMGEEEKDLAKRFFMLLYLFLNRNYEKVDLVFIRHTEVAEEVNEHDFFYDPASGGTVVSSALKELLKVAKERYPVSDWNMYVAQVSDGDNYGVDNTLCKKLLEEQLLPIVQYFAYIQVNRYGDDPSTSALAKALGGWGLSGKGLWQTYETIKLPNFKMKEVKKKSDIWVVFKELFEKRKRTDS